MARLFCRKARSSLPKGFKSAETVDAVSPTALTISGLGRKYEPFATEIAPKAAIGRSDATPTETARDSWRRTRKARQTKPIRKNPSYRDAPSSAPTMHSASVRRRLRRGVSSALVKASTAPAANPIVRRR